jgi:hypothetical protein
MVTSSKGPEVLTGTREREGISRRKALLTLGLTGLSAVTAACSAGNPKPARNQRQKPMPPKHPSHDTSQGVVTCDRKKGLIRVVDPEEAQRDSKRYSLRTEDCWEEGAPSNVDPLPPAAPASPTNTPSASK